MTGQGKINCCLFVLSSVHLELCLTQGAGAQIAMCGPTRLSVRPPTSLCWLEFHLWVCIHMHLEKDVSCQELNLFYRG